MATENSSQSLERAAAESATVLFNAHWAQAMENPELQPLERNCAWFRSFYVTGYIDGVLGAAKAFASLTPKAQE